MLEVLILCINYFLNIRTSNFILNFVSEVKDFLVLFIILPSI